LFAGLFARDRSSRSVVIERGKVVVVTGASQGIGRGIALRFGEVGARVVVHHRSNAAGAREVVAEIGSGAIAVGGDLRDEAVRRAVIGAFGTIDVLVNNAAAQPLAPFLEITREQLDEVIDSTLKSVFMMTQAAAKT